MRKETKLALVALPIIFLSNLVIGVFLGFGLKHDFFNTVHHYLGGVFVALFFYGYLNEVLESKDIPLIKKWFVIISATLFVGVMWEFSEWIGSYYNFDFLSIGDLEDTLKDLAVDSLGAVTLLLLHPIRKRDSQ